MNSRVTNETLASSVGDFETFDAQLAGGNSIPAPGLFIQNTTTSSSRGGHGGEQFIAANLAILPQQFDRPRWHGYLRRFLDRTSHVLIVVALAAFVVVAHRAVEGAIHTPVSYEQ